MEQPWIVLWTNAGRNVACLQFPKPQFMEIFTLGSKPLGEQWSGWLFKSHLNDQGRNEVAAFDRLHSCLGYDILFEKMK